MSKNKKIAIITTHSFGYIDFLIEKMNSAHNVDLTYINIDAIPFAYKNNFSRVSNFFLKLFSLRSLKEKNRTNFIYEKIKGDTLFDQILIIRPDMLEREALVLLRKNSIKMSSFLFDGIENFKNQKKTLSFFDTIYSYDKKDVEKYKFEFLTNYIYDDFIEKKKNSTQIFAITSYDKRFYFLEKLANYLDDKEVSFQFIVKKDKIFPHKNIKIINDYLSISEVKKLIETSQVLVDIQKENQYGLSFRIFEALGYEKKLITNNIDIVNYDFYDENNILVVSEDNIEIPSSFFETEYSKIDPNIINKYKMTNWIHTVFDIKLL
tara:strand:+ start:6040 stop:7002 length:963 start_codon:yes stop_codon:yes gene_type:complete